MDEVTRTIVIFQEFGEGGTIDGKARGLVYFVFDGHDLRGLHLHYINSSNTPSAFKNRISELVYDDEGRFIQKPYVVFPLDQVHDKTVVVEFGIVP